MVISGRGIRNAFQREEEVVFGLNLGPGWGSARGMGRREGGSQLWEQTKAWGPSAGCACSCGLEGTQQHAGEQWEKRVSGKCWKSQMLK